MRKRIVYFLAAGLIAWGGITSFASADDDDETETDTWVGSQDSFTGTDTTGAKSFTGDMGNIEVSVNDEGTKIDTYQITMKWTNLAFTYSTGNQVWNTETYTWDDTSDAVWYATDDATETPVEPKINVSLENSSSQSVAVSFKTGNTVISSSGTDIPIDPEEETPESSGITLKASESNDGDGILEAAEEYVDDDTPGGPAKGKWTLTLDGEPVEDITSISIPLTCVITPAEE